MENANMSKDPIFTAIAKHEAAHSAFNAYKGPDDSEENLELERAMYAADNAWLKTVPTTLDGFKTKIDTYLSSYDGFRATDDEIVDFLDTLYKSACAIAGKAVQP
jgi:hypothetical protein